MGLSEDFNEATTVERCIDVVRQHGWHVHASEVEQALMLVMDASDAADKACSIPNQGYEQGLARWQLLQAQRGAQTQLDKAMRALHTLLRSERLDGAMRTLATMYR